MGDLSANHAFDRARHIINQFQLNTNRVPSLCLKRSRRLADEWLCDWEGEAEVTLNSRTGHLASVIDWKKQRELDAQRNVSAGLSIQSEVQARVRGKSIMLLGGAPQAIEIFNIELLEETESQRALARMDARVHHSGIELRSVFAILEIDRKDGKLVSLQQNWEYVIETELPSITPVQARLFALNIYGSFVVGANRYPMDSGQPTLVYVRKQEGFGSSYSEPKPPTPRLRIAFSFNFGKDNVLVDAVNGQSLGGIVAKERPH